MRLVPLAQHLSPQKVVLQLGFPLWIMAEQPPQWDLHQSLEYPHSENQMVNIQCKIAVLKDLDDVYVGLRFFSTVSPHGKKN